MTVLLAINDYFKKLGYGTMLLYGNGDNKAATSLSVFQKPQIITNEWSTTSYYSHERWIAIVLTEQQDKLLLRSKHEQHEAYTLIDPTKDIQQFLKIAQDLVDNLMG